MNVIEIQDIAKIYQAGMRRGNIQALDGVSLSVGHGEIFGLLGPNGAGKTTLVKILLGITRPTSGSTLIAGLPPDDPESRAKIGFLPENHRFPPHLTGGGLLEFAGRLHRLPMSSVREQAAQLLKLVGMEKWASTKIRKYSKGMAQRIGLAQAMLGDPDVMILDEPTDGVDPVGRADIKNILVRVKNEGKTIFLNSHLLSEVEMVADRVAILSRGKLARIGTVDEFTAKELVYEIEADIGNERIEIPETTGKLVRITTKELVVELVNEEGINQVIDQLRLKRIAIRTVKPAKVSLEQSFLETIREGEEQIG